MYLESFNVFTFASIRELLIEGTFPLAPEPYDAVL